MAQVKLSDGVLDGEVLKSILGKEYFSFKGIPYAAPPIGDLRFKPPQPIQPWTVIRNAKEHGPVSLQFDIFTQKVVGGEDCLYLNVYTPDLRPKKPLPVMFWIHGGGFAFGHSGTDLHGPDFLMQKEVILVTINYRLGLLGYLCLNTKEVPGNAGMKDQVAALRWVNKNIDKFGGDPKNITIFGESAGAGSVGYHLVSPMTKGLFQRAILQSGTNHCDWTTVFEPRLRAEAIARYLGKDTDDDQELYEVFKNLETDKIMEMCANGFGVSIPLIAEELAHINLDLPFAVVDEKQFPGIERFFHGNPKDACKYIHKDVEIIIGYNTDEWGCTLLFNPNIINDCKKFIQSCLPVNFIRDRSSREQLEIAKRVKEFYKKHGGFNDENVKRYLNMHGFVYDVIQAAKKYSKNNKVWLYKFNCYSERNAFSKLFGGENQKLVAHADDILYLFHSEFFNIPVDVTSQSFQMVDTMTEMFTNFAKFGNPTRKGNIQWEQFDGKHQKYLMIEENLKLDSYPEQEEFAFWEDIHNRFD